MRSSHVSRAAAAVAALLTLVPLAAAQPPAKGFRAGAYAIDITPERFPVVVNGMFTERSANAAHDRLYARCLALDDGTTRLLITIVDSLMMPRELLDSTTRAVPGDGVAPIERMLRTLSAKNYAGTLSVELFLQRFQQGDPFETATEIKKKAEPVMRKAGVL